jgi:Gpi18-like mannosyltransferase
VNLLVRAWLATLPGYVPDVTDYKKWALAAASGGVSAAYERTDVDYPPLLLYPLLVAGKAYLAFSPAPATAAELRESTALTVLIKTPHLLADLALAALLYGLVARLGLWGARRRGAGWGRLAAVFYLWNPAVLWVSAYWGQPEGVHSALAVAALACLGLERVLAAGLLLGAATLTKPLAAPLVPLAIAVAAWGRRLRGVVELGAGGLAAAVVLFLPFALSGELLAVVRRVFVEIEVMPATSANAHNLWWLLGPWRDANASLAGPVTPKAIGLALFGAAYLGLLVRLGRRFPDLAPGERGATIFRFAAAVSASFFFLSTHMHENHLYLAMVFLLVLAGRDTPTGRLAVACSLAVLLNAVLHDLVLPYGLPLGLSAPSAVLDPAVGRPYTWVQLVGSYVDTGLVTVVAATAYVAAWRAR